MKTSIRPAQEAARADRRRRRRGRSTLAALVVAAVAAAAALVAAPAYAAPTATEVGTVSGFTGTSPARIAVTPDGHTAYVTNWISHTVSIVDTSTMHQTGTVSGFTGTAPYGAIVSPDGKTLYVADWGSNSVILVSTATNAQTGVVSGYTGQAPRQLALSPDGSTLYVTNYSNDSVSVISTATKKQTATIASFTGQTPDSIALSPDGKTLYVGSIGWQGSGVQVINTATKKQTGVALSGTAATGLALNANGTKLYVAGDSALTVVNTAMLTKTAKVSGIYADSYGMAFSPDGSELYASLQGPSYLAGTVAIVNTTTDTSSAVVADYTGHSPMGIAALPDGGRLLVANNDSNSVSVVSTSSASLSPAAQTVTGTVGAAITPTAAITPSGFPGAVTYSVSPALPAGLSLDAATGVISGTPTSAKPASSYTVTGSGGSLSATATVSISVAATIAPAAQTASGVVGTALAPTTALTGAGFNGPVSYSLSPAVLPSGLGFDATTGVISGTPTTVISPLRYTITGTDGQNSATATITLRVDPYLTPAAQSRTASVGAAIAPTSPLTATGFPTTPSYSYSVSPALPAGLTLDPETGVVSGTPTASAATADYTITASNGYFSAAATVTITIAGLTPATQTVTAEYGTAINATQALTPSGLLGTVSYSVSPALPAGLVLDEATGAISGTPRGDAQAATDYTITGTGRSGGTATTTVTISVGAVAAPAKQTITGTAGTPIDSSAQISVHGLTGTVTFGVTPALPSGLKLNAATGVISGTPTAAQAARDYTLTGSSAGGLTAAAVVTISVNAALTPASQTLQATAGEAFSSAALSEHGFSGAVGYAISPALPAGLTLSGTTGVISGTPTTGQARQGYTITATDLSGTAATATVSLQIASVAPATQVLDASWGQRITPTTALSPTGFSGQVSYAVSPALPAGLTLDTATGVISGSPEDAAQGATVYTITGNGALGGVATASVSISLAPVLTLTETTVQSTAGTAITPSTAPRASGFPGAVTYSVSPRLPAGLVLDANTGVISGTPQAAQDAASYTLTASAGAFTAAGQLSIAVAGLSPIVQPLLADHGTSITPTRALTATGFTGVVSYAVSPALPDGLALDPATGVISGTPTGDAVAKTSYTITATGADAGTATAIVKLTVLAVAPAPPADVAAVPGAKQAYVSWTAPADDGGAAPLTYTITAVPGGQSCITTATSCILTGLAPGTETFQVVASTSAGSSSASSVNADVVSSIAPATVPQATAGTAVTFRDQGGKVVTSVTPGETVTVEATGFAPGSFVDAYLYSTPTPLGSGTTGGTGSVSFPVTVPTDLPAGAHTLVAAGFAADGTIAFATSGMSVASASAPAPTTPLPTASSSPATTAHKLAVTGSDVVPWLWLAAGLLLAGAIAAAADRFRPRKRSR